MHTYIHEVKYYETDKMGITHHSNYVRWMEEARMDYLKSLGYGMRQVEERGITSPVVSVACRYKHVTRFDDRIRIELSVECYTGAKLVFGYTMTNIETGELVLEAGSSHCFINGEGRPVALKKYIPELDSILKEECESAKAAV